MIRGGDCARHMTLGGEMKLLGSRRALESSTTAFTELSVAGRRRENVIRRCGLDWLGATGNTAVVRGQDREMMRSYGEDRRIFGM